ncbi:protein-methionine sulfoxide oxidase mical3a-like protein, partial [Lates japonicus]
MGMTRKACDSHNKSSGAFSVAVYQATGRFYCLQHYDCRLDALNVRKRPTASDRATSHRTSIASLASAPSLTSTDSLISADRRRSSVVSVMAATPERIKLENCRRSSRVEAELQEEAEEPEEVSEETLNQFNLNLDQKYNHRSSSESEMEEEARGGGRRRVTSEETKASCRETVQLHLHLRDKEEEEEEEEDEGDEEDEEEGGSEVETSDEGEYSPWEMERHSGLWLLIEEETEE